MKKTFLVAIAMVFLLRAWLGAERHTGELGLNLATSFDFAKYPACGMGRTSSCIQAIRFYDGDSKVRLAEVPVPSGSRGPQQMMAAVKLNSIPRRAYTVTVYIDDSGVAKEGGPGRVSTFDYR